MNLARLYLSRQPLWLLDEPFTAIDAPGVAKLSQRMAAHARDGGAVLLTSHQPLDVEAQVKFIDLGGAGEP